MITAEKFAAALGYWQLFLEGTLCTVVLSALAVLFGFIIALLLALMRMGKVAPLRWLATAYVELFRATPMVVQVWIVYFLSRELLDLPNFLLFGMIRFERFLPGVIALSLNSGAYLCEIIRSGIGSIPIGQTEAARSLGLSSWQSMRLVVLPQAIKNVLPALANEVVTMVKESSICSVMGMYELMWGAKTVATTTYISLSPYVVAAAIYFCINFPASKAIEAIERRMRRGDKR